MKFAMTEAQLTERAKIRRAGFREAVLALAPPVEGKLSIEMTDWHRLTREYFIAPPPPPKPRGLGDLVAIFAEPIARASDAALGTHLVGCNSCAERRAALNKLLPKL